MQHASEDLARAFRDAGHEAEVLIEPDDTASFSALGSWRAVDRLRPDLAVLINYPRHERSEMLPENVPVVCWVQDMMPHLVRAGAWEALGELDFVVGHAPARFFREGGLRPDRVLPAPVVVSEAKFHGELVDEATRAVFECEVAYVSHQSETPEDMCERIAAEIEPREVAPVLTELFPRVREAVASFANERTTERLRSLTEAGLRACFGDGLEANVVTQLVEQYTTPLAERMLRHQTLDWAVEICERRGWRLKIFGKGWERVERFAAFACGELAHGDALRASYRCAAVHLHPTVRSFVHQRPMECALSGGLALLRSSPGMLPRDRLAVTAFEMDRGGPEAFKADPPGYDVTEDWRAMMLTAQKQRLGYEARGRLWAKTPSHPEGIRRRTGPVRGDLFAHEIYGDLAEISFTDAAGLERLIERAVTRPAWREAVSAMVAKRVRRSATTRGLVELLTGFVSSRLGEAGERSSAA